MSLWVKIRSWHLIGSHPGVTLCGKPLTRSNVTVHDLPMRQRSCETCLRIDAKRQEEAPA